MIGQRVKELRTKKGLTVSALARAANVSQEWLYKLENGKFDSPGVKALQALSNVLQVSLLDLISEKKRGRANV